MPRDTHVREYGPPRLEIGVDIPCYKCKMKGEVNVDGKRKTCPNCEGRGFLTNKSADRTE